MTIAIMSPLDTRRGISASSFDDSHAPTRGADQTAGPRSWRRTGRVAREWLARDTCLVPTDCTLPPLGAATRLIRSAPGIAWSVVRRSAISTARSAPLGERFGRVYQVSRDQLDSVATFSVSASICRRRRRRAGHGPDGSGATGAGGTTLPSTRRRRRCGRRVGFDRISLNHIFAAPATTSSWRRPLGLVSQVDHRIQNGSLRAAFTGTPRIVSNLQYLPAHQRYLPPSIRATVTGRCRRWMWGLADRSFREP